MHSTGILRSRSQRMGNQAMGHVRQVFTGVVRQLDQRIASTPGEILKRGQLALGGQHGIDQQADFTEFDDQGGIAQLGDFHDDLRGRSGHCKNPSAQ
jgi:hypothetical protein